MARFVFREPESPQQFWANNAVKGKKGFQHTNRGGADRPSWMADPKNSYIGDATGRSLGDRLDDEGDSREAIRTPAESQAIASYQETDSYLLNDSLRSGSLKETAIGLTRMRDGLDSVTAREGMPEAGVAYRGVVGQVLPTKPGTVFVDKGYVSVTTSRSTAKAYAESDDPYRMANGGQFATIRVPRGAPAILIPNRYETGNEFVLARGTRFQVIRSRRAGDIDEIELKVLP